MSFWSSTRRCRVIRQTEAAECGLACLAMVSSAHGQHLDLAEMRQRFGGAGRGSTLRSLMSMATSLGLAPHAVKLDLAALPSLRLPCILHWDLDHFVVLEKANRNAVTIVDPATGRRTISLIDASQHFTGVALQLSPAPDFQIQPPKPRLRIRALLGRVPGLRARVVQILAVALALECFGIAAPIANQLIVDEALPSRDADLLTIVLVGFALLLVIQTLLGAARSWLAVILSRDLKLQWSAGVLSHLLRLPTQFFERRHLGDIVTRFEAVNAIQRTLTGNAINAVLDGVFAVAALVMMFLYSAQLTAIVIAAVALYAVIRVASYGSLSAVEAERMVLEARQKSHFLESLRAIVPIKLFDRTSERIAHWQTLAAETQDRETRSAGLTVAFVSASQLIVAAENLAVLGLGAYQIMAPSSPQTALTIGMLFAFVSYKDQFTRRVMDLVNYGFEIRMLELQVERLSDIVQAEPEPRSDSVNSLAHLPARVELRDVGYRYGPDEPWVLRSLNLTIEPGECVAIVGPSGCGKTTLVKLLLSLLEPTEGEVLYSGVPIRRLGIENYRRTVGVVMQEDALISGTIATNVAFCQDHLDRASIERVCRDVGIHDDIARMPMGYQTLVGDLGSSLSGGQRQRLLLARALYRNPSLLVLDEATSHLDVGNEHKVNEALGRLSVTRIVIAHRPETIAACDRVVNLAATSEAAQPRIRDVACAESVP